MNNYYIYILTNKHHSVLYIGMTEKLRERVRKHRSSNAAPFTTRYNCKKLIYYEFFDTKQKYLEREKQLKKWNRSWKIQLIEKKNPNWIDLYEKL